MPECPITVLIRHTHKTATLELGHALGAAMVASDRDRNPFAMAMMAILQESIAHAIRLSPTTFRLLIDLQLRGASLPADTPAEVIDAMTEEMRAAQDAFVLEATAIMDAHYEAKIIRRGMQPHA